MAVTGWNRVAVTGKFSKVGMGLNIGGDVKIK
jgi:hypothetical protein